VRIRANPWLQFLCDLSAICGENNGLDFS